MTKWYPQFVLLAIRLFSITDARDTCEIEISYNFIGEAFKWDANHGRHSKPLCLGPDFNLIERECRHGKWYPANPQCQSFRCPEIFTASKNTCRYISEPRTFDSGCPHVKTVPFITTATTDLVWVPRRRKINFNDTSGETDEDFDCVVEGKDKKTINVDCASLYSHVCSYKEEHFFNLHKATDDIDVRLKFDASKRKMFLTVYSPESLKTIEAKRAVRCYTNARGYVNKNVDVDEVYDSRKMSTGNFRNFVVFELDIADNPGQYWCDVYQIGRERPTSTGKVVGFERKSGNEYSLRVVVKTCLKIKCATRDFYEVVKSACDLWRLTCRLMQVFADERDLLVHVTTDGRKHVIGEFHKLNATLLRTLRTLVAVVYFRSSEMCLPEETNNGKVLSWRLTPIGSVAAANELCVTDDGMIATRTCNGDFLHGAQWTELFDRCSKNELPERTRYIHKLVTEITTENFKNLTEFSERSYELSSVDVAFVSDGLYQISLQNYSSNLTEDFTKSVSNVIKTKGEVLVESQNVLNSTDKILDALEIFLSKKSKWDVDVNNDVTTIIKSNFLILITKPFVNNVTGLALYGNDATSFLENEIVAISRNQTFDDLNLDELQLAVYVPENLLQSLTPNLTVEMIENIRIIITIFYNDNLFNSNNSNTSAASRVVGVTIPGYGTYLETPIPLLFRPLNNSSKRDCAYWDYGQNTHRNKGAWSTVGNNYFGVVNDSLIQCAFSHLTHFALLILSEKVVAVEDSGGVYAIIDTYNDHNLELSVITATGCSLSLIGIVGIFLTGMLFRKWRQKVGTKILLQLSITIVLEIVTTQLAGIDNWHNRAHICTLIGILLHYIVLAKFSWMLVIAFLQYLRYVKVLGGTPSRLILKASLIGWLVPTVPVLLTAVTVPSSYSAGIQKFCYPKGLALYIGLIVPAVITIVANILVFSTIMLNISRSKAKKYDKSGKLERRHAYLAILLFFMLGIPWVFGILAEMLPQNWLELAFVYLFCLTATLQGFVLFLFYVLLDNETRLLWTTYIKTFEIFK